MNNWKRIWENRNTESDVYSLDKLIAFDGFDTGYGTISTENWLEYIGYISNKLSIEKTTSIYEVGCGAGAFLYPFYKLGCRVGGLDYSRNLVSVCNKVLESEDIRCSEAIQLDPRLKYDIVISNSVFFYFSSYEYANAVLEKMLEKASDAIAVLEINNLAHKEKSLAIRRAHLTEEEYEKRYKGLEHLYFSKDWFLNFANKHNLDIYIEDQNITGYVNNEYRFNVYMFKK